MAKCLQGGLAAGKRWTEPRGRCPLAARCSPHRGSRTAAVPARGGLTFPGVAAAKRAGPAVGERRPTPRGMASQATPGKAGTSAPGIPSFVHCTEVKFSKTPKQAFSYFFPFQERKKKK